MVVTLIAKALWPDNSSILAADVIMQHHKQLTGISLYNHIRKCTNAKSANRVFLSLVRGTCMC